MEILFGDLLNRLSQMEQDGVREDAVIACYVGDQLLDNELKDVERIAPRDTGGVPLIALKFTREGEAA